MAIGDAYATAATYRGLLSKTDASEDVEVLDDLTAVSRSLERRLGRFFTSDAGVVARIYYPKARGRDLYVDDIGFMAGLLIKVDTDLDGLFTDETAWAATDYELHPLNAALEPEAGPWTRIRIPGWSTKDLWDPAYPVQVTARFGWPAVPKAIERATCHITGILRLESPRATSRVSEGVDRAIDASPEALKIVGLLAAVYGRPGWSGAVFV